MNATPLPSQATIVAPEQALMIKPDYAPAQRQLARFKVVPRGTPTQ